MSQYLLDTSAYSRFASVGGSAKAAIESAESLTINVVALGELRGGYRAGSRAGMNEADLRDFLQAAEVRVVPITEATADLYAQIWADQRRHGRMLPTNDIWIAATAIEHGLVVLTGDRHFGEVEGLEVELLA